MNTKISYMYRDADNFKTQRAEVIAGELSEPQIGYLLANAGEGLPEGFIPSQVGFPDLQIELMAYDYRHGDEDFDPFGESGSDHVWHEILGIAKTNEEPTVKLSATQFYQKFSVAMTRGWDVEAAKKRVLSR